MILVFGIAFFISSGVASVTTSQSFGFSLRIESLTKPPTINASNPELLSFAIMDLASLSRFLIFIPCLEALMTLGELVFWFSTQTF